MGFLRNWRRRRVLKRTGMGEALWKRVVTRLPFLRGLSEDETSRLKQLVLLFLAEKELHGAHGFVVGDEMRVSIAAQACLPILKLGLDTYSSWVGVIVYPGEFRVQKEEVDEAGVVHSFDDSLAGEAWPGGPVVLSWEDAGMTDAGYNVVIHEFAHKIHMEGTGDENYPAARAGMDAKKWRKTLEQSYEKFCAQVDADQPTIIDPYASEHPAEFFAVMSETFFTQSAMLARDWPELYGQLAMFYKQDPAGRAD